MLLNLLTIKTSRLQDTNTNAAKSYIDKKLMNIKKILQPLILGTFIKADIGSHYLAALQNTVSSISM